MGSLCNFRPMRHPHSLKPSTIHTNKKILYAFNLPNTTARLTRTRNHTSCLVVAQKNNNGRNPEKRQGGGSESSLNIGSNGILPKQEKVARRKRGKKYQKPSALQEFFSVVLQLCELFVSMCSYTLQTMKSSIKFEFNWPNLKSIGLGLIIYLASYTIIVPFALLLELSGFVLVNGLKISAVIAIIGFGYVYLF